MTVDLSLIPQNRINDLVSTLSSINDSISTINTNISTNDGNAVHKTGNETIAGNKTFTGSISTTKSMLYNMTGNNYPILLTDYDVADSSTAPNSVQYQLIHSRAANGDQLGQLQFRQDIYGTNFSLINVSKKINGTDNYAEMGIAINSSGTKYTFAPTPATSDNSTKIATTEWKYNNDNLYRTNCITEIPQDIKVELDNGTLTLKAGSKVYVPNGVDVFDVVTIPNDIMISGRNLDDVVYYNATRGSLVIANSMASGDTMPSGTAMWYDTTNNIIRKVNSGVLDTTINCSFPLCTVKTDGTTYSSIDQVFNGFGYIGSTVFALPGVKGLIPNGRNADGSLKNFEFTVNQVHLNTNTTAAVKTKGIYFNLDGTIAGTSNGIYFVSIKSLSDRPSNWTGGYCIYVEDENRNYVNQNTEPSLVFMYASLSQTTTNITSFNPKTTFHALDYNELDTMKTFRTVIDTYISGTDWYRVWSDGWIEQGGLMTAGTTATVTLHKPFSNTNYSILTTEFTNGSTDTEGVDYVTMIRSKTTTNFTCSTATGRTNQWYACGY